MALRRGFKSEATALSGEVRSELGLSPVDRLDVWELARLLEIPVITLSSLAEDAPDGVACLTGAEEGAFSAATVFLGQRRLIVHNDSHALGRQRANVAHEMAHGLLLHSPYRALDNLGCRHWDQDVEDEADWLAGVLLVAPESALRVAREDVPLIQAAATYGVSTAMMQWRLNATGALIRVKRPAS